MNVLSLFDGISCGQLALQRAGVAVTNYYSSEIDKHAIKITQKHFPNTIQLGDITKVDFSSLPKIDLLIGGSPCQGFSFAGKMLEFKDERSSLIEYFFNAKNILKPKYFLLENVKMRNKCKKYVSDMLGVEANLIDSSLVSKQSRKRFYWTNVQFTKIIDKELVYDKMLYILPHGFIKENIKLFKKHPTLTATRMDSKYRLITDIGSAIELGLEQTRRNHDISRVLTPEECEELQTLPIGYTSTIAKTNRCKTIGNSWTVDLVAHIFKAIKI